jgi:hypothetical protein
MNATSAKKRAARRLRNRRGAVLVMAAASMAAILGAVALAVDVGLLYTARGEAQKAADAAALAGAGSFIQTPGDGQAAADLAENVGEINTVRNDSVQIVQSADVSVDVPNEQVTVIVRRIASRGNGIPTFFARIFGLSSVDVEATATAEAIVTGTVSCLRPFAPPDAFFDANGNGTYDGGDYYDTATTGYGSDYRDGQASNNGIDPPGTSYVRDWGRPIVLKEATPQQTWTPSQYFPITLPEPGGGFTSGANDYRNAIANCHQAKVSIGDWIPTEPGRMWGPTVQGTQALIAQDQGASWDVAAGTVTGSSYQPWRASPRIITIPLFDPQYAPVSGRKDIKVANVTAFWVEDIQGQDVIGRFMFATGVAGDGSGGPGGANVGPALKAVRLIH